MTLSKIAIIGPGLLGGSIALAMRKVEPGAQIAVWARRAEAAQRVDALGIADLASTELDAVVADAGLIVLCVPIGAMPELAEQIAPRVSPETLVTDVGSVKASVVESLAPIFKNRGQFVGSHPMAGSERTGIEAASARLFEGAVCMITPDEDSDAAAVAEISEFWRALGCVVRMLPPDVHDEIVALVSHLPHLLAASLVDLVCACNPDALHFCGNGFRDTTRVASGPPEMWAEILRANRGPLKESLDAMIENLREAAKLLGNSDDTEMKQFLARAKTERDRLRRT
jgi:prephenate dehydrogenase